MGGAQAKRLAEMQNNEEARVEGEVKKKEARDTGAPQSAEGTYQLPIGFGGLVLSRDVVGSTLSYDPIVSSTHV